MFKRLSSTATDIFNINIPIFRSPPEKRINIEEPHRPFNDERIMNILASHSSSVYVDFTKNIGWNNISITTFPTNLQFLPAMVFKDEKYQGIILNIDLCAAYFDLDKQHIVISDYNDFTSCLLYGLNKLICYEIEDETVLNTYFFSMIVYIYSLLMRIYSRDFDIMNMRDQELGSVFYLISKLICTQYFEFYGNSRAVALGALNRFFTKDEKRIQFTIDVNKLPEEDISSWNDLFVILTQYDLMGGITIEDFRNRITRFYGMTGVVGISCGLELITMLNSVSISSNVFHRNIKTVNPSAVRNATYVTINYLRDNINKKEEEDEFFLDRAWGEE